MIDFPVIALIILGLLVIVLAIALQSYRIMKKEYKKTGKYPEGHYMGLGMGLGLALGIPIGIAMGNIAFGPGIGLAIGVAMGAALEKKYKDRLRPLTDEEKKMRRKITYYMLALALLGLIAFIAMIFIA